MAVHTGSEYAAQALLSKYDKLKYDQYDCQAFCELVLRDIGVRKPDGSVYNWKGSNDIARHACSWIGTVDECIKHFGKIPVGAWAFMWDNTGNEKSAVIMTGWEITHISEFMSEMIRCAIRLKSKIPKAKLSAMVSGIVNYQRLTGSALRLCLILARILNIMNMKKSGRLFHGFVTN